jgi:hypothetical protein
MIRYSDLLFGRRVMRLAPLHVAALLHQVAYFVRWHSELALGADVEGRSDQKVVAPSLALGGYRFSSLRYSHDAFSQNRRKLDQGEKIAIIRTPRAFSTPA